MDMKKPMLTGSKHGRERNNNILQEGLVSALSDHDKQYVSFLAHAKATREQLAEFQKELTKVLGSTLTSAKRLNEQYSSAAELVHALENHPYLQSQALEDCEREMFKEKLKALDQHLQDSVEMSHVN